MGTPLRVGVSGLRGVVGRDMGPSLVLRVAAWWARGSREAFVARDTRPHSPCLYHAALSGVLAAGARARPLGVVPTPTLVFHTRGGARGLAITASHNPVEFNAVKVAKDGRFPFPEELKPVEVDWPSLPHSGAVEPVDDPLGAHLDAVLSSPLVEADVGLRVAYDPGGGAGREAIPRLLLAMGARVLTINPYPEGGRFPRPPEPTPASLGQLDRLLREGRADLGLATDPDADRLVVGLGGVGALSEEYTLLLVAYYLFKVVGVEGKVVTNLSTTAALEALGVPVIRTPVGEANVVKGILEAGAPLGGEGNGGVILPEVNLTRDSLVAAALVLSLAKTADIRGVLGELPKPEVKKLKLPKDEAILARVRKLLGEPQREDDGLYYRGEGWWLHIRPSNTEPILRLTWEGNPPLRPQELASS